MKLGRYALTLTPAETAYICAANFRARYNLTVATDRHDNFRADFIAHDYLHWLTNLTPSELHENVLAKMELGFYQQPCLDLNSIQAKFLAAKDSKSLEVFKRLHTLGL